VEWGFMRQILLGAGGSNLSFGLMAIRSMRIGLAHCLLARIRAEREIETANLSFFTRHPPASFFFRAPHSIDSEFHISSAERPR
jgi:hypothetical protein